MLPVAFACKALGDCGLSIKSHSEPHIAGYGSSFTRTEQFDPVDYSGMKAPYDPDPDFIE